MEYRKCKTCGETKPLTDFYECKIKGTHYYRRECKKCTLSKQQKYVEAYRDKTAAYHKQYYLDHKDAFRGYARKRRSERLADDPVYAMKRKCWLTIWKAFNENGQVSEERVKDLLGCSSWFFTRHLKRTWKKLYGKDWAGEPYNIDHIIPLVTAQTPEEVRALCHYENLRLLTPEDNADKGKRERNLRMVQQRSAPAEKGLDNEA